MLHRIPGLRCGASILAVALLMMAADAHALTITATAYSDVGNDGLYESAYSESGQDGSVVAMAATGSQDEYGAMSNASAGESIFLSVFSTALGSSVEDGEDPESAPNIPILSYSSALWENQITAATLSRYTLDLSIAGYDFASPNPAGLLRIAGYTDGTIPEYASVDLRLELDHSPIWTWNAVLGETEDGTYRYATAGPRLTGYSIESDDPLAYWRVYDGQSIAIELGQTFAAGDSFTLSLVMEAETLAGGYDGVAWSSFEVEGNLASTPVPEPATILLLGTGFAGLAVGRRRHRG